MNYILCKMKIEVRKRIGMHVNYTMYVSVETLMSTINQLIGIYPKKKLIDINKKKDSVNH